MSDPRLGRPVSHGAYCYGGETAEHYIWRTMLVRCRLKERHYENVRVCERWLQYQNFLEDMGPRPSPKHSLDRYPDPDGDYEPDNCRWATHSEQMKNRRGTPHFVKDGQIGTVSDWAKRLGISTPLARYRWNSWGTFVQGEVWQCVAPKDLKKMRSENSSVF